MNKKPKTLLFCVFLFFSFFILFSGHNTPSVNAQICQDDPDCDSGWFCSTFAGGGECCHCLCGPSTGCNPNTDPNCDGGDRECCNDVSCSTTYITRCYPCLPDPDDPTPTPTLIPCCSGDPGCGNYSNDYDECIGLSCTWNCAFPTATPIPLEWACIRPGAIDPSSKCEHIAISCVSYDNPGGLCYSSLDACIAGCVAFPTNPITPRPAMASLCYYGTNPYRYGIFTAIGCFPSDDTNEMLAFILRWSLGVAGGISFLLIVFSGFMIMGSGANTEKVKSAKELLTAALTGIILLIFSVFILDFFGLRIFRIPGL